MKGQGWRRNRFGMCGMYYNRSPGWFVPFCTKIMTFFARSFLDQICTFSPKPAWQQATTTVRYYSVFFVRLSDHENMEPQKAIIGDRR